MVGVLKIEKLSLIATPSDIRKLLRDNGSRPEEIHLILDPSGRHIGAAFLIFTEFKDAEDALRVDGTLFRDRRVSVKTSHPQEFNKFFPGVAMISKQRGRGRGLGRGMSRGISRGGRPAPLFPPEMSQIYEGQMQGGGFNSSRGVSRGRRGSRGGRGGRGRGGFDRNNMNSSFVNDRRDHRNEREVERRERSRSPVPRDSRTVDARESFLRNFSNQSRSPPRRRESPGRRRSDRNEDRSRRAGPSNNEQHVFNNPLENLNERKFLRICGLPYNVSEVEIQDYFRPILTRDIFFMRNIAGKFAGKSNGSAIVEFFSENDARQALKMDGGKFGSRPASVVRPTREDVLQTVQRSAHQNGAPSGGGSQPPGSMVPDMSSLGVIANANPDVQHLLNLLTVTVNTIAAATQQKPEEGRGYRNDRSERKRDDPVISRVANSANIDVNDIKLGRVVGIRNLPFAVTPDEILKFFHGFYAIPDSVRIHYLEDGRCSGDAIICFRGNRDARNAVSTLNKRNIGRRKVELFFL